MLIRGLSIDGLSNAHGVQFADWGSRVDLPGGPVGVAVADALSLFFGALGDAAHAAAAVEQVGIASASEVEVLEEEGRVVQLSWPSPSGAASLLHPLGLRRVMVKVELALDPRIFGILREHAVREPRLVTGLSADATVVLGVGWLFTNDLRTAAVGLHQVKLGTVGFPLTGGERPRWVDAILPLVCQALQRPPLPGDPGAPERLLDAQLSDSPSVRQGFDAAATACAEAPFSLGRLALVRSHHGLQVAFGAELVRARQLGLAALEAIRLVEAVHIRRPDILVVESPGAGLADPLQARDWLESHTSGKAATLEQVLCVPGGGV